MLTSKILVIGKVVRIVGNKIYIKRGNTTEVYNADYYRVVSK